MVLAFEKKWLLFYFPIFSLQVEKKYLPFLFELIFAKNIFEKGPSKNYNKMFLLFFDQLVSIFKNSVYLIKVAFC